VPISPNLYGLSANYRPEPGHKRHLSTLQRQVGGASSLSHQSNVPLNLRAALIEVRVVAGGGGFCRRCSPTELVDAVVLRLPHAHARIASVATLAELGVRHIEMPATPERVWHAIRAVAARRV
jgi:hypothetical protein